MKFKIVTQSPLEVLKVKLTPDINNDLVATTTSTILQPGEHILIEIDNPLSAFTAPSGDSLRGCTENWLIVPTKNIGMAKDCFLKKLQDIGAEVIPID